MTCDRDVERCRVAPLRGAAVTLLPPIGASGRGVSDLDAVSARILELELAGVAPTDIAREVGLDRTNVWRRQQAASYRAELAKARAESRSMAVRKLAKHGATALDVIA